MMAVARVLAGALRRVEGALFGRGLARELTARSGLGTHATRLATALAVAAATTSAAASATSTAFALSLARRSGTSLVGAAFVRRIGGRGFTRGRSRAGRGGGLLTLFLLALALPFTLLFTLGLALRVALAVLFAVGLGLRRVGILLAMAVAAMLARPIASVLVAMPGFAVPVAFRMPAAIAVLLAMAVAAMAAATGVTIPLAVTVAPVTAMTAAVAMPVASAVAVTIAFTRSFPSSFTRGRGGFGAGRGAAGE
jgi:hypothetical protein